MKKLGAMLAASAICSCGVDSEFKDGFPRASTVELKVPGTATTQPLTGATTRHDGLEGDTAMFYGFTRGVTTVVNGGAGAVLSLVERITETPPTSVTADSAVWGPVTEALSPNTWRFTVTRRAPNDFAYRLEGRGKTQTDADYRTILSGTHMSAGHRLGTGTFTLDWQAALTLPEHDTNVGQASFVYARPNAEGQVQIDATFTQVRDNDSNQLVDATYHYAQVPAQGGSLEFQLNKNLMGSAEVERLAVRSRWQPTGAGRADVQLSGGDLQTSAATVSECWDSSFASRFFSASFELSLHWGAETTCAFSSAEYARR
jgi:hypothetical protein